MAKNKTLESEELMRLLDEYRLENPGIKLAIPKFGAYVRSKGIDIQDYTIRRDEQFRKYVNEVMKNSEEKTINDLRTAVSTRSSSWTCRISLDSRPSSRSLRSTRIMAIFMISAAVPWIGEFMATRSPKERCMKLAEPSSGTGRRRPNMVETKPFSLASATRPSRKVFTPGYVSKY